MEGLLAEINAKKRSLEAGPSSGEASKRYKTRGELEAEQEEEERRKKTEADERRERLKAESRAVKMRKEAEQARKTAQARLSSPGAGASSTAETETFNISPEECVRRLRLKSQPIRLFGETDKDRRLRLRALELLEERGEGTQNDFKRTLEHLEMSLEEKNLGKAARLTHASAGGGGEMNAPTVKETKGKAVAPAAGSVIDLNLLKDDPNKLYPLIYFALKGVTKEWEEWMDARPEEVKRSGQGKMAAATQVSSALNLKPLFRQLRNREVAPDVLRGLSEIVHFMQTRHYQKANDSYLRLSIGTAAWPIGVTAIGLHERSSQDKLYVDKIAHVLNDEVSRKWIQAVKRLITFSQTIRPPKEISQMMG